MSPTGCGRVSNRGPCVDVMDSTPTRKGDRKRVRCPAPLLLALCAWPPGGSEEQRLLFAVHHLDQLVVVVHVWWGRQAARRSACAQGAKAPSPCLGGGADVWAATPPGGDAPKLVPNFAWSSSRTASGDSTVASNSMKSLLAYAPAPALSATVTCRLSHVSTRMLPLSSDTTRPTSSTLRPTKRGSSSPFTRGRGALRSPMVVRFNGRCERREVTPGELVSRAGCQTRFAGGLRSATLDATSSLHSHARLSATIVRTRV